jgi:hypothetical protein
VREWYLFPRNHSIKKRAGGRAAYLLGGILAMTYQYPAPHRCGACDAPAGLYRCPTCFPVGKADYVATSRLDGLDWVLVIDPAYTRAILDPRCDCGLPADHRNPLSGMPRPCADETERIAIPGRSARPPVRPTVAPVLGGSSLFSTVTEDDATDRDGDR